MTAREYFSILDSVIQGARERGILRSSGADDLLPDERLEFLSSATATIYIQAQRRTGSGLPPVGPAAGATPPTSPPAGGSPASPPPKEGDTHGEHSYHKCPACGDIKLYKKWWPGAECWDCYREATR